MELKFKNTGQTTGFLNWLKSFKEILPTLLIEIDFEENAFISKCFPPEKVIVKYSKISFAEAGYELVEIKDNDGKVINDWNKTFGQRIKVGIFNVLPKFIDVINMFTEVDHIITIKFNEAIKNNSTEYHAEDIQIKSIKSKLLTMKIKNCIINEFFIELPDKVFFDKVCHMDTPMKFNISSETIKNLISISSVFSIDQNRDAIKFYTKFDDNSWGLYAFDETNDVYDYLLAKADNDINMKETSIIVFRKNFITATKGINNDFTLSIDGDNNTRLIIDAINANIVVAGVQNK